MANLTTVLLLKGRAALLRLMPATLFGRLALLLFVAVLASHVLAFTLMFELRPGPPPGFGRGPDGFPGGPPRHPPLLHPGLLLDIGVRLAALMLAAWIGARWLSQPIRRLASAAHELGRDIHQPPLVEGGTTECREATRVFNLMQAQIRQQLGERDRFVAAVSHDLRTPLTRLRLRAEGLVDSEEKSRFGRDIMEMDHMITATLDYLRGAVDEEPFSWLDINALVATIADDREACGDSVQVQGEVRPLTAQVSALRRCIGNLVDNAIRYGGQASIRLMDTPEYVCIEVCDNGPGIPEAELEKVLAPFYRVEGSRNRNTGGVGLGLSIAHDIARKHQGRLILKNNVEGGNGKGLVATLQIPRKA
ncbi:MAG TPA: ATP-binding protein [Rhodoferax sp.]|nr:ATP-binding protein [Rhodoferax sp.]HPW08626.1 ATP-binding protein [Burkholderiaceae bacterium]